MVTLSTKGVISLYLHRLEDLRIDSDLTQSQVAEILHCKREVYRRYEKGIRELPLSYAIILAKYYSVSVDYLVGLSDEK
jgi:transcriptional regulator with XRE-family HTH domain